jgi:hypothetical protein
MLAKRFSVRCVVLVSFTGMPCRGETADEFDSILKPVFAEHCVKCHGGEKVKGKVNLKEIAGSAQLLKKPELLKDLLKVIESGDMPPEEETALSDGDRTKLQDSLKSYLSQAAGGGTPRVALHRLNRYQYNNAVRDLFRLKRDVFSLPEKMMTRQGDYLHAEKMPDKVNAVCLSLRPEHGLMGVIPFPKDLRAAHGFDNQANQLTLSPLLLDSFLKLSVSILESPDFNDDSVGIWNEFFKEPPAGADLPAEIRKRLAPFLNRAFRRSVDPETLGRYSEYTLAQTQKGLDFTACMKKVASAVMSSPMFLYEYDAADAEEYQFNLASRLSFFLWASGPDEELLRLAERGELSKPEILNQTVSRMMTDPKIERFLDTFPAQWMQLENVLAAKPEPGRARLFKVDEKSTAATQMVLEPLLLFDAVFLENRPIIELIQPSFGYQSDFLRTWYASDLKPPQLDVAKMEEENRTNEERRKSLKAAVEKSKADLAALLDSAKARSLAAGQEAKGNMPPVELKPMAAWEFDGDLQDSVGALHLHANGGTRFEQGMVILENDAFLQSDPLPVDIKAKTLEVWCKVHNLGQSGGGLMGIQGPGDFFDTIVLGERKAGHWISGSNHFARTADFPESAPETATMEELHLTMVYAEDGTVTMHRNGKPYGKGFRTNLATFPKGESSVLFGLRHLPQGKGKCLSVSLARARLYDRALTAEELAASNGDSGYMYSDAIVKALTPDELTRKEALSKSIKQSEVALKAIPNPKPPGKAQKEAADQFDRSILAKLKSPTFERLPVADPRYGGIITNAAMATMTSGPDRTHPIARGSWIIEVILNDPPDPPPNNVPPLKEDGAPRNMTIREQFAEHRKNPDCASCHSRLDPLGFAMENFDIVGRWRDKYENGLVVDPSGTLLKRHPFAGIVDLKESLVKENRRFAKAFTAHLLRFALGRELSAADSLTIEKIITKTERDDFRLKSLMREIVLSDVFLSPD